jgi:hypothetical protein
VGRAGSAWSAPSKLSAGRPHLSTLTSLWPRGSDQGFTRLQFAFAPCDHAPTVPIRSRTGGTLERTKMSEFRCSSLVIELGIEMNRREIQ